MLSGFLPLSPRLTQTQMFSSTAAAYLLHLLCEYQTPREVLGSSGDLSCYATYLPHPSRIPSSILIIGGQDLCGLRPG